MKYTSSEANKLLKEKNDLLQKLVKKESLVSEFVVSLGEDPKSVRPDYSYQDTQAKVQQLEKEIRTIKHSINVFNTTTIIPEYNITIDEMLVLIPQLTKNKSKLERMASMLPKQRKQSDYYRTSNIVEYTYANFDIATVEEDYLKLTKELAKAQTALDTINNTVTFDIPIE